MSLSRGIYLCVPRPEHRTSYGTKSELLSIYAPKNPIISGNVNILIINIS